MLNLVRGQIGADPSEGDGNFMRFYRFYLEVVAHLSVVAGRGVDGCLPNDLESKPI